MAVRLHLKAGLIADKDRLDTSPDTILVTEPSIGSVSRSKGSIFVVITANPGTAARSGEATALVADTIRRDYYYDESAGIPICLEKAIRSANRRLRHGRESHGLGRGSVGGVVAVVRGHELYVAAIGDGNAYLVRQARLLTLPEDERSEGMPSPDEPRIDVWRGDVAVGDSLILVSGNVTRLIPPDELKNAVVTLHPQSAVEHLHHLFVAAGGDGSDAVLVIEATEVNATRAERRLVPVAPLNPLAGAPDRSPIPLADPIADAAAAVQAGARQAREAAGGAVFGLVDRFTGLLPRRGARYRRVTSPTARRESQRRAAFALLSFLALVLVLGVSLWYAGGALSRDEQIPAVNSGENALASARDRVTQVTDGDLVSDDSERALRLLREAWAFLGTAAEAGVVPGRVDPLRQEVTAGLDELYDVRHNNIRTAIIYSQDVPNAEMIDVVQGPDGATYAIDEASETVVWWEPRDRRKEVIVEVGDGPGDGIAAPWQLAVGGPEVLILDRGGGLWRWRPSNEEGRGTLSEVGVEGDSPWGDDVIDSGTYVADGEQGLYNFYVLDPSERQILRYLPAADGSGFPSSPTGYLATARDVSDFHQLYIDGDIYALTSEGVIRHENGRDDGFELEVPPDDGDVRPGHDYRLLAGTGGRKEGLLYVWDAKHRRIVVFSKEDGSYIEQFVPLPPNTSFKNMRGLYLDEREEGAPALMWLDSKRLRESILEDAPLPTASPSPAASPASTPEPAASGGASPEGEEASVSATP